MATPQDLDFTYTLINRIFRLSIGEMGDFSGAKYDGDFSLTLEPAQRRKHEFVALSLGAFEHFCSSEQYRAGKQETIYRNFFRGVADLIPAGSRFFLQTMVFGKNMIPIDEISVDAPRDSAAFALGLMTRQFPGSWLPYGDTQLIETASPYFRLVSRSSGRLDYIETIRQWRKRFAEFSLRKTLLKLRFLPRYLTDPDFRLAFASGVSANSICFDREILDHYRLVFEKV